MNQIFSKILEDYKRANQKAKDKMIKKFGFDTESEFFKFLNTGTVEVTTKEAPTDMVIAFDTTGSMSIYIAAVRQHVKETIDNLFENVPDLKLKIVAFGDYCDMSSPRDFGKAYQETPLTNDKSLLIDFVKTAKNTGGGDSEEFYELVLAKIISETPWRNGANKSILLIADEHPHEVGYTLKPWVTNAQLDWREEARTAARLSIKIDTLRIHPTRSWYQELSSITNGTCMNFKSANKTQNIVEASTYLNSRSEKGIFATKVLYRSAVADGDMELVGAYKGMAADRGINLDE